MVEHEKKRAATARAGKDFAKLQAPMTFSQGSKILNAGVQVMRILGWAWRWAGKLSHVIAPHSYFLYTYLIRFFIFAEFW